MARYFVDASGRYLGGYEGVDPPEGSIEVPGPAPHGRDTWDGERWIERADAYKDRRFAEYPPGREYLDAKVKQGSPDPATAAEGRAQERAYIEACLAVKAKYPRPPTGT